MIKLCRFGRAIISAIYDYIDEDDGSISDEEDLYGVIEDLFREDGWIDVGEVEELQRKIEDLEQEVYDLNNLMI